VNRRGFLGLVAAAPALKPAEPRQYYWIHCRPAPCGDSLSSLLCPDVQVYHHKPGSGFMCLAWSNRHHTKAWDGKAADYERVCRVCFP
jgi:hypothetical protein